MKNQNKAYEEKIKREAATEALPQSVAIEGPSLRKQMKTEVLFFLRWNSAHSTDAVIDVPSFFGWSPWAYLSEMNETSRAKLIQDAEHSGLIFKVEEL